MEWDVRRSFFFLSFFLLAFHTPITSITFFSFFCSFSFSPLHIHPLPKYSFLGLVSRLIVLYGVKKWVWQ
ncbi:uncharacterized protein BO95DRAFT_194371 [Aspergillus brunneoviolaceus CBS 621.78]|uniref:Uncharacterized protein n=1 Tax=Aspergillus brunneoviolaceus CBS 621.78 TaxID=1450534 RepID=A0ACD1GLK3_9EURO|nr:hypothetical protein BO95DRAFT_194371 [Aspergillus brunneoviolaceus CBS 621.78]RAH50205.1 hypothetical protein BO95DRAFT_194371 [Aspergillus brunneoviolaceus CBS 621.78]